MELRALMMELPQDDVARRPEETAGGFGQREVHTYQAFITHHNQSTSNPMPENF